MSENTKRRRVYITSVLSFLGAWMLGFGHACSQYTADGSGVLASIAEDAQNIIYGEKTTATVYSKQIVDNFQSCLGVRNLSANNTIRTWNNIKASISEGGEAGALNAPMMMAIATIAGEVCRDLVDQERNLAMEDRQFFSGVDLGGRVSSVTAEAMANSINGLARACWQRNETSQELEEVLSAVEDSFAETATTIDLMTYTCAGILASTDSFTF